MSRLMERQYRGEADGILCWKLDHLARNPVDGGSIIWAMKEYGMKIITPFQAYGHAEDNTVWMYLEFGMAANRFLKQLNARFAATDR